MKTLLFYFLWNAESAIKPIPIIQVSATIYHNFDRWYAMVINRHDNVSKHYQKVKTFLFLLILSIFSARNIAVKFSKVHPVTIRKGE